MNEMGRSPDAGDRFVTAPLPEGFRVRLRPGVATTGDGRVLVGGSPRTLVELGHPAVNTPEEVLTVADAASAAVAARLLADNLADPVVDPGDGPTEADLTVVVPAYNSPQSLDRALTALAAGPQVIVVDDASSDGGATAAVAERHGARLIRREANGGPAAARNTGLRAVGTPLVAFVDADIRVTATALRGLLAHFADPGLALVAPVWWESSTRPIRAGSNGSTACTAVSTAAPNPHRSPMPQG
ncbi:glycosyltransferase family 2 protein [Ammonicoccus fulvus]|uniref:Glycosyltransferase family 2 protein n=1 Tax=Ammonicoccus fulvus TaxID=3138240 RepID=A0ABZ3FSS9_9ACTN